MDRLSILHLFLWKSNLQMILCQIIFPRVWLIGWLCPPFLSWCCFHSSKYICRYLDVPFKELFFKKQHGAGLEFLPPAAGGISLSIQPKGQQRLSFSPHKKSVVLCLLIPTNSLPIARSAQEAIPPPNDLAKFVSVWCFWKRPINSSNSLRSLAWVDFQYRRFAVNSLNKSSMTLSDSLLFRVFNLRYGRFFISISFVPAVVVIGVCSTRPENTNSPFLPHHQARRSGTGRPLIF